MEQPRRGHNTKILWALVLLGIAFSSSLYYEFRLTGTDSVEGIIGVLLGLYICSHPAANLVDLLFFRGGDRRQFSSRGLAVLWLGLNVLVLLVGWLVIFIGTTRLIGRAD